MAETWSTRLLLILPRCHLQTNSPSTDQWQRHSSKCDQISLLKMYGNSPGHSYWQEELSHREEPASHEDMSKAKHNIDLHFQTHTVSQPTREILPGVNMVFQVTITSLANPALCWPDRLSCETNLVIVWDTARVGHCGDRRGWSQGGQGETGQEPRYQRLGLPSATCSGSR